MRTKRRNKKKSQLKHAVRKARERFGLDLTQHDIISIIRIIQEGNAKIIERQSNRISVFLVSYNDIEMRVVYDRNRKSIVTVMYSTKEQMPFISEDN